MFDRKIKIALYGGAFNPIHAGHIGVAKFVLNTNKLCDEVWLVPCDRHINDKNLVNASHRLAMCRLASQWDNRIKVFDYEIIHRLNGETYTFLEKLLADTKYTSRNEFKMILGMDKIRTFDKWVKSELLKHMISFVIVPRKGVDSVDNTGWYTQPPHICLFYKTSIPEISSTQIRESLLTSLDKPEFLNKDVWFYILKHHLKF